MSSTHSSLPLHTMTTPCPLLTLSTELILQIIHFLPPEFHADFALSCQQIHACSASLLRRHQTAHKKYRVVSDLDPATIPTLLRTAAKGGPHGWIDLWHVRAVEIWRDRGEWGDWRAYHFDTPVQDLRNAHLEREWQTPRSEILKWEWRAGETVGFLDEWGEKLDEEMYEKADKEMREGKDGLLKCLVVGLCPRLRDLRFVENEVVEGGSLWWLQKIADGYVRDEPQVPAAFQKWEFSDTEDRDYEDEDEEDESEEEEEDEENEEFDLDTLELDELQLNNDQDYENDHIDKANAENEAAVLVAKEIALQAHRVILSKYWPPGLFNVRNVAVGIPSSTWLDIRPNTPSTQILSALLRLPNITTLYYANLQHVRDDPTNYMLALPPGCSSLRHLYLDNCDGDVMPHLLSEALTGAPRNLITAAFRSGYNHLEYSDDFVGGFGRHQSASLESLMFYDYGRDAHGTIHGYRCAAYKPDEFDEFQVIKQLSISIYDVDLGCLYQDSDASSDADFYVKYVGQCFPASLECLVLWDTPGSGHAGDKRGETKIIERAVVKMIRDKIGEDEHEDEEENHKEREKKTEKEKAEEEKEKARRKLYKAGEGEEYQKDIANGLDTDKHYPNLKAVYLEEIEQREPDREPRTKLCFQDAIAAGKEGAVDVHTLTNRGKMLHEISFPEAPDKYSLESGPHWGTRPVDWVFNPYIGRRVPKGCGMCGICEKCLAEYPKELWETLGEADDRAMEE
jgi:hypothetical protein